MEVATVLSYLFLTVEEEIVWKVAKYGVISIRIFLFGLNTDIYGVNLRIKSKYRKIRTKNNYVFGHFSRSGDFNEYKKCFKSLAIFLNSSISGVWLGCKYAFEVVFFRINFNKINYWGQWQHVKQLSVTCPVRRFFIAFKTIFTHCRSSQMHNKTCHPLTLVWNLYLSAGVAIREATTSSANICLSSLKNACEVAYFQ